MAEELNSQVSSQPVTDVSVGAGPNAAGKPSEPVTQSGMTSSQSVDYYNKTQQLAQQRRELEAERNAWEQERARYYQQNGNPQNQSYGGQYPAGQQTQSSQNQFFPQVDPHVYANLVEQFGKDGADAQVRLIQQSTAPVQQQLAIAQEQARLAQITAYEQSLNLKGAQLFGEEWNTKGPDVMNFVKQYGIPIEKAWYAVNGEAIKQAGIDSAYQAQAAKAGNNVQQSNVQPAATQPSEHNSFSDAFSSAWGQYNS